MAEQTDWDNITRLAARRKNNSKDDVKFVISSEKDFLWSKNIIEEYRLDSVAAILLSPVEFLFAPSILAELIMKHRLHAKMQLQLCRLLWPQTDRGI